MNERGFCVEVELANNSQLRRQQIDQHATQIPMNSRLPLCLYVPVAARDKDAIEKYVGRIVGQLSADDRCGAVLVETHEPITRDDRLAIWGIHESVVLHYPKQVWVHVDYRAYRRAYIRAFPDLDLGGLVLDHVMNRRVARLKGYAYLRLVPISRSANSTHGGLSEGWGVKYHSSPEMMKKNRESRAVVQYADLADIVKMLNLGGGGSVMENVNEAQKLIEVQDSIVASQNEGIGD